MIPSSQSKVNVLEALTGTGRWSLAKTVIVLYTFAISLETWFSVSFCIGKVALGMVWIMLAVLGCACTVALQSDGNKPPEITRLEVEHVNIYPHGSSKIKCVVSDPDDDIVQLKWSCTGGSIIGDWTDVTWQAPNDYGDYHIMVIAKDGNGGAVNAIVTVSVVPRPHSGCCGR